LLAAYAFAAQVLLSALAVGVHAASAAVLGDVTCTATSSPSYPDGPADHRHDSGCCILCGATHAAAIPAAAVLLHDSPFVSLRATPAEGAVLSRTRGTPGDPRAPPRTR
jgi:hypothetical protein